MKRATETLRKDQFWNMIDKRINDLINAIGEDPSETEKMNLKLGIIESLINKSTEETITSLAIESKLIKQLFMVMEKNSSGWTLKHKAVNLESAHLLVSIYQDQEEHKAMIDHQYNPKQYEITSKLVF
jgi:hypothetical protein